MSTFTLAISCLTTSNLPWFMDLTQRRQWHPTPVLLPGKSHGRRSLVGCSPWGREESDTTEWLHFDFLLSCTREGNGNPLQYSCMENPRDGGARWAAIYEVAESQTWLKRLSSSSSSSMDLTFQVPMQYCSLQHWTLLLSPVTSTTGYCFCFGSIPSFFLELFLHWSPIAYWAPTDLGSSSFSMSCCLFILFMGFSRQEYWSGLPFPCPVDHILSDLSTMTSPSWVAPHGMA